MNDPKNLTNLTEVLRENLTDVQTLGCLAEIGPKKAKRVGAYVEDALNEQEVTGSSEDFVALDGELTLTFIAEEDGPITDLPAFIDTETVHSLYGWKPGESLEEAIVRKKIQKN